MDVKNHLVRWLAGAIFVTCVPGCGGRSETPPAAKPIAEQGGAAANSAPTNAPGNSLPESPAPKEARDKSPVQQQQQPVAGLPAWDSEKSSSIQSRFGIIEDRSQGGAPFVVDGSAGIEAADRFLAAAPEPGFDSSRFAVAAAPAVKTSQQPGAGSRNTANAAFKLPDGFEALPEEGTAGDGMPLRIRCRKDNSVMALVPEGTFMLGVNGQEANAGPQLSVFLNAYYIDVNEVTVAQYDQYRDVQRQAKKRFAEPARTGDRANEPVTGVSWTEAHAYALWAEKDLPTEAEWEKAARGAQGFRFPWGNGPSIWHRERTADQIDPIGTFRGDHSPFGVYDLAGNAREWCADYYGEQYYSQLAIEGGSTPRNPTGPKSSGGSNQRVVRGGDANWFVWTRAGIAQSERPPDVGFRCVLRLKGTKAGKSDSGPKGAKS